MPTTLRASSLFLCAVSLGMAARPLAAQRGDAQVRPSVLAAGVDSMAARLVAEFEVPGMAVGIIRTDTIVLAKGYGVTQLGTTTPVTPRTIFGIGSITKSMTGFLVGRAVVDGDLAWDTPVRAYWPGFTLPTTEATERATVFDFLSHQSGIPRLDGLWQYAGLTDDSLLTRLPWLPAVGEFRGAMQYSNINYAIVGGLLARTRQLPWAALLARDLFDPLGMTSSWATPSAVVGIAGVAGRHTLIADTLVLLPGQPTEIEAVAASGSVFSNLEDMLRYLQMLLGEGQFDDRTILEHDAFARMLTPAPGGVSYPDSPRRMSLGYGAGWFLEQYDGEFLASHSGVIEGYSSQIAFMPKRGIGVVVLSNRFGNPAPDIMVHYVLDRLTGREVAGYFAAYQGLVAQQRAAARAEAAATPYDDASPGIPADYLGQYSHPAYGMVTIGSDGADGLVAAYGGRRYALAHHRAGVFVPSSADPAVGAVGVMQFLFGPDHPPTALTWEFDDVGPIRFERRASVSPRDG